MGLQLKRIDFNEPQMGKSACDRFAAVIKRSIRSFVDEGNDVINASQAKNGILHHSGANVKVSLAAIDKSNVKMSGFNKIDGISSLHSFSIDINEKTILANKYYKIGKGQTFKMGNVIFENGLTLLSPFSTNTARDKATQNSTSSSSTVLSSSRKRKIVHIENCSPKTSFDYLIEIVMDEMSHAVPNDFQTAVDEQNFILSSEYR